MNSNGSMNTTEILFALIRSEIFGIKANGVINEVLSNDLLQKLYRIAKAHDIAHILSSALYKQGMLGEDEVSQKFKKEQKLSVYRCENMKSAFSEICSAFEKNEILYVPLKGSVLRPMYPEEWMRTSCDIDILIHENDLNRAVETLVGTLGYKAGDRVNYHDVSLFSQTGVHLELHFNIKERMDNIDRLLSEVWKYIIRENDNVFRCNQTPEYFVFHHVAHMSYHFVHGGCGIKPFIDLYIIRNKMNYDDTVVRNYCKQCGIEDFYNNVLYVTDVWFGNGTHTQISHQIESYIIKGGVYGSLENKVMVEQNKKGSKAAYALSRIFITYDSLKNYYPILKKHKWLFPFMQVRRWFRLIFCGGFKRGVREMKVNQNVSQNQVVNMSDFLREIGL